MLQKPLLLNKNFACKKQLKYKFLTNKKNYQVSRSKRFLAIKGVQSTANFIFRGTKISFLYYDRKRLRAYNFWKLRFFHEFTGFSEKKLRIQIKAYSYRRKTSIRWPVSYWFSHMFLQSGIYAGFLDVQFAYCVGAYYFGVLESSSVFAQTIFSLSYFVFYFFYLLRFSHCLLRSGFKVKFTL